MSFCSVSSTWGQFVLCLHVLVEGKRCSKRSLSFLLNYMDVVIFKMGKKILVSFPFCKLCVKYLTSSLNYLHW